MSKFFLQTSKTDKVQKNKELQINIYDEHSCQNSQQNDCKPDIGVN